jgi:hypothetical protein
MGATQLLFSFMKFEFVLAKMEVLHYRAMAHFGQSPSLAVGVLVRYSDKKIRRDFPAGPNSPFSISRIVRLDRFVNKVCRALPAREGSGSRNIGVNANP